MEKVSNILEFERQPTVACNDNIAEGVQIEISTYVSKLIAGMDEQVVAVEYFGDFLDVENWREIDGNIDVLDNSEICEEILDGDISRALELEFLPVTIAGRLVELANKEGLDLRLDNLSYLNQEQAAVLTKLKGPLSLSGLGYLDDQTLANLLMFEGELLDLSSLNPTPKQAWQLIKFKGLVLNIGDPESTIVADILSQFNGHLCVSVGDFDPQTVDKYYPFFQRRKVVDLKFKGRRENPYTEIIPYILSHEGTIFLDYFPPNLIPQLTGHNGPVEFVGSFELSELEVFRLKKAGMKLEAMGKGKYSIWKD